MSDLRTGLVEAVARTLVGTGYPVEDFHRAAAEIVVDAALDFLIKEGFLDFGRDLAAALSDSRDTGEKP